MNINQSGGRNVPEYISCFENEQLRRHFLLFSLTIRALAGRYGNPVPTRFLAPIDCSKIPTHVRMINNDKNQSSGSKKKL